MTISPSVEADVVDFDLRDGVARRIGRMAAPAGAFADSRIVIVDDVEANVALLKRILIDGGLKSVETYTDASAALAACLESPPDLLLLDLQMPRLDGFTVLQRLDRDLPAHVFLPVIVLTADGTSEVKHRALTAGAKDFLTKPLDSVEVILRVWNTLETAHLYKAVDRRNSYLQAVVEEKTLAELRAAARRKVQLQGIEDVMASGGLDMVFQRISDLKTGCVVGVEALARFSRQPYRPPNEWFADAAEVGMGTQLELMAVRAALDQLSSLPPNLFMSVNVSPATAVTPELAVLTKVDPERVVIELTEHVPIDDYPTITDRLNDLKREGVRISVDDTGAGYAGLALLVRLSPDIIKLDRYLVTGIVGDPCRRALASALREFSVDIGATLVAEGIEDAEEFAVLRRLAVPLGQGYYLGRPEPLPAEWPD
jgi:EAL domain-containing protein (putative c-di-GMP-specific phosphodiesterase class I)